MKLQTMLLPTGEFILIASNVSHDASLVDAFRQIRENSGACAGMVFNGDVEVENALVDENARRADQLVGDISIDAWATDDEISREILDRLRTVGVEGFSPAGLVKLTDEEKAERNADGRSTADDDCACYPPGLDGPMCSACPLTGTERKLVVEDVGPAPRRPKVGDKVEVLVDGSLPGTTEWRGEPILGQQFQVNQIIEDDKRFGGTTVWLDELNENDGGLVKFSIDDVAVVD